MTEPRKLRVFPSASSGQRLCHALQDKLIAPFGDDIRELNQRLLAASTGDKGWVNPWLDEV